MRQKIKKLITDTEKKFRFYVFNWRLTGDHGRVNDLEKPSPGLVCGI
jgi:hypothetical protein